MRDMINSLYQKKTTVYVSTRYRCHRRCHLQMSLQRGGGVEWQSLFCFLIRRIKKRTGLTATRSSPAEYQPFSETRSGDKGAQQAAGLVSRMGTA